MGSHLMLARLSRKLLQSNLQLPGDFSPDKKRIEKFHPNTVHKAAQTKRYHPPGLAKQVVVLILRDYS